MRKLIIFSSFILFFTNSFCKNWDLLVSPASFNKDKTIRVCKGYVQDIIIYLQASKEIKSKSSIHEVVLTIDVPKNVNLIDNGGVFEIENIEEQIKEDVQRRFYKITMKIENRDIIGEPGSRASSEWLNHSFFFYFPDDVKDRDYITFSLITTDTDEEFHFPLESIKIDRLSNPSKFRMGLWSYDIARIQKEECAEKMAQFLQDVGINYVQSTNPVLHKFFQQKNIVSGGYVHHGWFYDKECSDYLPDGKPSYGGYPCPYCVSVKYKNNPEKIKGVEKLIETAKMYNGYAVIDYEPTGLVSGFCEISLNEFMKRFNIDKEKMNTFKEKIKNPYPVRELLNDKEVKEIWGRWYKWYNECVKSYVKLISDGFHNAYKDGKFEICCSRGSDEVSFALACDQKVMLPYVDGIQPQIYSGYDGAGVKLFINEVKRWREEIEKNKLDTKLYPLILIRYAGATVFNSPERVAQQIIGAISEGADGVIFYFPGNMDATYWRMLPKTLEILGKYEDFYKKGYRIDEKILSIEKMPKGETEREVWPGIFLKVKDFDYHFTAHKLGKRILLTMMNLRESNDIVFYIKEDGKYKVLEKINVEKYDGGYLVSPQNAGFLLIEEI